MGFQIEKIDFNIRSKIFIIFISFLLWTDTSFAHEICKKFNEIEIDLAIPPSRIFKAIAYDFPTLGVIILPQVYKKIDLIHGDGGVGTIVISHLQEGISPGNTNKERVEARDDKKLFYSVTMLKGPFPASVQKLRIGMTFKATTDGAGTIIERKSYFYTTCDNPVTETEITAFNEQVIGLLKAFAAYLVANPDA